MQLYDATVRLNGDIMHEVPKKGLTAPEVLILQSIHGGTDAVVDLIQRKMDKRTHEFERDRLGKIYTDARVLELFGPYHSKLPVKLNNVEIVENDELTDEDIEKLTASDD